MYLTNSRSIGLVLLVTCYILTRTMITDNRNNIDNDNVDDNADNENVNNNKHTPQSC